MEQWGGYAPVPANAYSPYNMPAYTSGRGTVGEFTNAVGINVAASRMNASPYAEEVANFNEEQQRRQDMLARSRVEDRAIYENLKEGFGVGSIKLSSSNVIMFLLFLIVCILIKISADVSSAITIMKQYSFKNSNSIL